MKEAAPTPQQPLGGHHHHRHHHPPLQRAPAPVKTSSTHLFLQSLVKCKARNIFYTMALIGLIVNNIHLCDMNIVMTSAVQFNYTEDGIIFLPESRYKWSLIQQHHILGSYYIGYVLSQIVCLFLVGKIGMKLIIGIGLLVASLIKISYIMMTPEEYAYPVICRLIEGFFSGVMFPLLFDAMTVWVPIEERSFFSTAFSGVNLGIFLTYTVYGYIYTNVQTNSVFYLSAILGVISAVLWLLLIFNTPEKTVYISPEELKYIENNTEPREDRFKLIPWLSLTKCPAILSLALAYFGRKLMFGVFLIYSPRYVETVEGVGDGHHGPICGAPFLISFLVCWPTPKLVASLIKKNINRDCLRKSVIILTQVVPGGYVMSLYFFDYSSLTAFGAFCSVVILNTMSHLGNVGIPADIASNFQAQITVYLQAVYMVAPFLSTILVAHFLRYEETKRSWQDVFLWCGGVSVVSAIPAMFLLDTSERRWNCYGSERHSSVYDQSKTKKVIVAIDEEMLWHRQKQPAREPPPDPKDPRSSILKGTLLLSDQPRSSKAEWEPRGTLTLDRSEKRRSVNTPEPTKNFDFDKKRPKRR